ncbi:N-acetylmuramoyl-L-alanine amidase [Gemmobacter megaterium]|uniref:N-acetylmuramoyl-L-alanine amidase n=1 Tax=Gemmobacter megaterium TaxID=1086013 RepID=A0A1N7NU27_9RHOB|nr:N-acetylmuramoyl-L-alanine amidase [Gemmobacter megaterium]GGE16666.1 N-acetylmuramoyl-L-alanine amidase [Gemmobacter megaterium]SIT01776.1 N-acetylmuramoyl-L-alanine amidase [Gemmobacter megaterium]
MIGTFARAIAVLVLAAGLASGAALAQSPQFSALARADGTASRLWAEDEVLALDLALSHAVPWRLRFLAGPPRLVVDFREVDFRGLDTARLMAGVPGQVTDLRAGPVRDGWSRLVVALDRPRLVAEAELRTAQRGGEEALLRLRLAPAAAADFAAEVARPDPPGWTLPKPARVAPPRKPRGQGPLVVVLDPGHGGLDPGAERDGHSEAQLMLTFARELKEALVRAGVARVVMTREDDSFVPLETRVAIAHQAVADVFLSLHADALPEGVATGATVYTLAAAASDEASAALAERHDRDALMSGVDLTGQDDLIAGVLMDMARRETSPRAGRLAEALVAAMREARLTLHKVPRRAAAFSVLKAPDIPSVLIELGYMSSPRDLARLTDPAWRAQMAGAIVAGLAGWAVEDAAAVGLLRQ